MRRSGYIWGRPGLPFLFALLLIAVCGLAACSSRKPLHPPGTEIVVALEAAPTNLDPRLSTDAYSERVGQVLFRKLVRIGRSGEPVADLATSWETPSPTVYRFHLDPRARFHDGTPVTARDVNYTFRWILNPDNKSPHRTAYEQVTDIVVEDDHTIRFELSHPHAPFLVNMVRGIVPAHLGDDPAYRDHPVGSGPYRLLEYVPGVAIRMEAVADYPQGAPPTRWLTFRILPEDTVRLLALKKGEVHLVMSALPPDSIDLLAREPNLVVERGPGTNYNYLGFNLTDPLLSRLLVRQAIALAIDRQSIVDSLYRNQATLATGLLTPEHWAYAADVETWNHDPERARKLLDAAGFPDPPGPEPRFRLAYKTSQNELTRRIGEVLQQQLAEVGIAVSVRSYEWGTFYGDIKSGNFQLYTLSWVGIADPDMYYFAFHSTSAPPEGANRGRYVNPEVDRLVEAGRLATNRDERAVIYRDVQRILARDLPYVSLWHPQVVVVRDRRLSGFELTPRGDYDSLARTRFIVP
ncbi:MAG: ABC transporter substrate-binding protein [Nitrospirota bacterium]|nr:ABC transporter substrate-binding protein [Nitrospirota bacterium]